MSLLQFDVQGSLFENLGAIAPKLFSDNDKGRNMFGTFFRYFRWSVSQARSRPPLLAPET